MYLGVALNLAYDLMTLLTASRKSFSVAIFLRALMANIPASVHTLRISAPERKHDLRECSDFQRAIKPVDDLYPTLSSHSKQFDLAEIQDRVKGQPKLRLSSTLT